MAAVIRLLSLAVLLAAPVPTEARSARVGSDAQENRAAIRGRILNADGAAAAGVPMKVVHEATGESRQFVSGIDGRYALASLRPGTYRLETAEGFEPATAIRMWLRAAQDLELDIHLGLASFAMNADVRSAAVPFERQSSTSRTRVDPIFIDALPLDGRNVLDLALLAPGVVPGNFALAGNGTGDESTSYYVDGSYNTEPLLGTPAARLPIDAIDELDVRTATFAAATGRSAGTQVNVVTRSGTNRLRAGALGFYQTDAERVQLGAFGGGPLTVNRTFLFGSYQLTDEGDKALEVSSGQLLSVRADHVFNGSGRLTGRYALDDGGVLDRRGQQAGVSVHTPFGSALANELRFSFTRVAFGNFADAFPFAESSTYQLTNATTWTNGAHLITAGAEWHAIQRGLDAGALSGATWGLFVQNDWQALPSVTINAGVRFDRVSPDEADGESVISPRFGLAWTVDPGAQTVVSGGYGTYRNLAEALRITPDVDAWTIGVRRRIGRNRMLEGAYVATRGEDFLGGLSTSRYEALQLAFEQRSELGISALIAYTYSRWTENLEGSREAVRAPLDSRNRLAMGFVAALPFGDERRWFTDGVAAAILGNMELSGIFTLQTGRPMPGIPGLQARGHRNVDLALLKNVAVGERTLQLRLETFNLADRTNLERGRRFQFGGRVLF